MVSALNAQVGFAACLRDHFRQPQAGLITFRVARHSVVYTAGQPDDTVYLIDSGTVKQQLTALSGKACLLAMRRSGDILGESCLAGLHQRQETAIAMEDTLLRQMPCAAFLVLLGEAGLVDGLTAWLVGRVLDQQRHIAQLVTLDSEHRLGETLLRLAQQLGRPASGGLRVEQHISHQELSEMVGTTRPRISSFMSHFHRLGLLEATAPRHMVVRPQALRAYLDAEGASPSRGNRAAERVAAGAGHPALARPLTVGVVQY